MSEAESFSADEVKIPQEVIMWKIDGKEYTISTENCGGGFNTHCAYVWVKDADYLDVVMDDGQVGEMLSPKGLKEVEMVESWLIKHFNPSDMGYDDKTWFFTPNKRFKEWLENRQCEDGEHEWSNDYVRDTEYDDKDETGGVTFGQRCNYCDVERRGSAGGDVHWDMAAESGKLPYYKDRQGGPFWEGGIFVFNHPYDDTAECSVKGEWEDHEWELEAQPKKPGHLHEVGWAHSMGIQTYNMVCQICRLHEGDFMAYRMTPKCESCNSMNLEKSYDDEAEYDFTTEITTCLDCGTTKTESYEAEEESTEAGLELRNAGRCGCHQDDVWEVVNVESPVFLCGTCGYAGNKKEDGHFGAVSFSAEGERMKARRIEIAQEIAVAPTYEVLAAKWNTNYASPMIELTFRNPEGGTFRTALTGEVKIKGREPEDFIGKHLKVTNIDERFWTIHEADSGESEYNVSVGYVLWRTFGGIQAVDEADAVVGWKQGEGTPIGEGDLGSPIYKQVAYGFEPEAYKVEKSMAAESFSADSLGNPDECSYCGISEDELPFGEIVIAGYVGAAPIRECPMCKGDGGFYTHTNL